MNLAICAPIDIHAVARHVNRFTPDLPSGLGSTVTTPLTIELLERGHNVTVYTLSNDLACETNYEWGSTRIFVGPSRVYGAARDFYRMEIDYLKRVIRSDAPAFVNAHWTYEFALGALSSGVPCVTTIHDLPWNVLRYFRDRCRAVRLLMAYMVAVRGRRFTAVSPDAAQHFSRWMRPGTSIQVIPNFLSKRVFEIGDTLPSRGDRGFTFVTILQGWSRRKNGSCALEAFQIVRKSYPDCCLIMIGAGYEVGGEANLWAAQQGLTENVTFRGEMQHDAMLQFVMKETDVLVHPSRDEAFSVALLECMALKKPAIGGLRTPGVRWVLGNSQVGMLVDVGNPDSVAKAMEKLASDEPLRMRLSQAAYEKAWNEFRSDVVVPQYESLYQEFEAELHPSLRQRSYQGGSA